MSSTGSRRVEVLGSGSLVALLYLLSGRESAEPDGAEQVGQLMSLAPPPLSLVEFPDCGQGKGEACAELGFGSAGSAEMVGGDGGRAPAAVGWAKTPSAPSSNRGVPIGLSLVW